MLLTQSARRMLLHSNSRLRRGLAFSCALAQLTSLLACGGHPTTTATGSTTPPPSGNPAYFGTEPAHATYLPRSDSYCASAVTPNASEPRPDNAQANHTVVFPPHNWSVENYWTLWRDKRDHVTGNFTGTTTEIIQWAACKWGIDEDTIRADAVQESYWHMSTLGDVCGPAGEASYGLLQIKNEDCSGTIIHGGYPHTMQSTALNLDWYAAHIRSCYDGDFYDGGNWLYLGQTVDQIAAQHGWSYVFWTCIGAHFSGNWSPGQPYELQVREILANRTWESPGF
jgi:hypothetical protein